MDPILQLRCSLGELTMTIADLEDTRDRLNSRIEALQLRVEATRDAIKTLKP